MHMLNKKRKTKGYSCLANHIIIFLLPSLSMFRPNPYRRHNSCSMTLVKEFKHIRQIGVIKFYCNMIVSR